MFAVDSHAHVFDTARFPFTNPHGYRPQPNECGTAAEFRTVLAAHGIAAGQQVFHNKFGEGRVLAVEGAGDDARAQVNFPRHGVKWLALSIAKLTVVD